MIIIIKCDYFVHIIYKKKNIFCAKQSHILIRKIIYLFFNKNNTLLQILKINKIYIKIYINKIIYKNKKYCLTITTT